MALRREQKALRPVVLPPDEQPYTEAAGAGALVTRGPGGRLDGTASARALAKMPRGTRYVSRDVVCDPKFTPHNRRRLRWLRKRRAELHEMTGGVSHGVGAMLAAASWLYAAGEFCCELAAEKADPELFKVAGNLTATARTHDMGAWEMATREAQARPKVWRDPLAAFRRPEDDELPPPEQP